MVTGLVVDDAGLEVLAGDERIGSRRPIAPSDVELLTGLAARYVRAVHAGSDAGLFVELGRELYQWLDGNGGQLRVLLERAARPVVFEVTGPRVPSEAAWAVLRAPFELLAPPGGGLLAEDALVRFCVARRLGAAEGRPPLDQFRLGLAFMASSPRGQRELDFEAEEAAILTAVGESRLDLVVEDTGDPEQLARRLAAAGGMPVVHLSCHGVNNWSARPGGPGVPALMVEDEVGGGRPTTAGDLVGLLTAVPRLLFVSACLTATGADASGHLAPRDEHKGDPGAADGTSGGLVAHSLATALVAAGIPAVVGWDGSVGDRSATAFAERLYRGLADQADLAVAVGDARRVLLESDDPQVRADWHLARLWLGPAGGGPLVGGVRKRSLVTATRGTKTFLDRKQQVPVAAAQMFVGRRLELQQALRALRSGDRAGVLLLAKEIEDLLDHHDCRPAYEHAEFEVVPAYSGARDIGTPDVCGDGIRRQDLEVRPWGVEPQSGDTEVASRPAAADGRFQLIERVIGVRGAGRQKDLEGHTARGRRGESVTEERQTGAVDKRRYEAQRAPCLNDELHERLARRATQPWRQRSTSGQRCDQIPGLADGDRAAAEHPRSALLACRGDALAIPSEPCSEDPDQFGVESGSRRCGAVREGRQQEVCEFMGGCPGIVRAHEDAADQLGVVHVSQPRTGSRADRTTRSGRGND